MVPLLVRMLGTSRPALEGEASQVGAVRIGNGKAGVLVAAKTRSSSNHPPKSKENRGYGVMATVLFLIVASIVIGALLWVHIQNSLWLKQLARDWRNARRRRLNG